MKEDLLDGTKLKEENNKPVKRIQKVEDQNQKLTNRVSALENKLFESNIIFHGVNKSAWENDDQWLEKIYNVILDTMLGRTYDDKLQTAMIMGIKSTKWIGTYRSMKI